MPTTGENEKEWIREKENEQKKEEQDREKVVILEMSKLSPKKLSTVFSISKAVDENDIFNCNSNCICTCNTSTYVQICW